MGQASAAVSHQHQIVGTADWRQIQQLRVELSQKNLKLESTEADYQRKVAALEQKLADTLHQKQLLQVSLCICVCVCVCVCVSVCVCVDITIVVRSNSC